MLMRRRVALGIAITAAAAVWTWLIYDWGARWLWVVDTPDDPGAELAARAGYVVAAVVWAFGLGLGLLTLYVIARMPRQ